MKTEKNNNSLDNVMTNKERDINKMKRYISGEIRGTKIYRIPYALKKPRYFKNPTTGQRTIFAGYRGFDSDCKDHIKRNKDLLERAYFCAENGYYPEV